MTVISEEERLVICHDLTGYVDNDDFSRMDSAVCDTAAAMKLLRSDNKDLRNQVKRAHVKIRELMADRGTQ